MTVFHFAPLRLGAGSIIQPGNWGRMLKRYHVNNNMIDWKMARELVFEQIRSASFAAKPSRLDACFALPTSDDAQKYRQHNDTNFLQVLHEVEVVDQTSPTHVAALSYTSFAGNPFLDSQRMAALSYWRSDAGDPAQGNEIVTTSALRVLKAID